MLKPLHNNIILKKEAFEQTTASGIFLTETPKDLPCIAFVVAIGPNCQANLTIADKVVYKEYSGVKVKLEGVEYMIIKDEDILAVIV